MSSLIHDFTSQSSLNLLKWSALKATHNPIYQGLGKDKVKSQFLIAFPRRNQPIFRFHRTITEMKNKFIDYPLDNPQQFSFHYLRLAAHSRGWIFNSNFDAALLISRFSIPAKCHLCASKTCKSRWSEIIFPNDIFFLDAKKNCVWTCICIMQLHGLTQTDTITTILN